MNELNPNAYTMNQEYRNRMEREAARYRFAQENASNEKNVSRFSRIRAFIAKRFTRHTTSQARQPIAAPRWKDAKAQ